MDEEINNKALSPSEEAMLAFINQGDTQVETSVVDAPVDDATVRNNMSSTEDMLKFIQQKTKRTSATVNLTTKEPAPVNLTTEEPAPVNLTTEEPAPVEPAPVDGVTGMIPVAFDYDPDDPTATSMLPVADDGKPLQVLSEQDYERVEESKRLDGLSAIDRLNEDAIKQKDALSKLSPKEKAEEEEKIKNAILQRNPDGSAKEISGMGRRAGFTEKGLALLSMDQLLLIGNAVSYIGAGTEDGINAGLSVLKEYAPAIYDGINFTMSSGNREDPSDDPRELAKTITDAIGAGLEFSETIPVLGGLFATRAVPNIINKLNKSVIRNQKALASAQRYNPKGAELATMEARENARILAAKVANENVELSNQLIQQFEAKTGTVISTKTDGKLSVDPDLARAAGKDKTVAITERDAGVQELFLPTDTITSPILDPDQFNGIVAVASELKKIKPEAFNNKKSVIDNLLDLTISKDMVEGDELLDVLNKYGLSFENYVLTVVGSGSDAGKVLNSLSQIKRAKPDSIVQADKIASELREATDMRMGIMRIENIRRGGLVSQVATAARNLTSGGIRAPMESLGNVMDSAIYAAQNKGTMAGVQALMSRDIWSGSFSNMKYMFSRPDVAKGYTDLILGRPEMAKQFDAMYNNLNEIQKLTGRGSGGKLDNVLSGLEDVVDTINTPNRWQEYLIRRGQFFGELERLTKRHYDVDLIDTLNAGKLTDLMNDASTVRPKGAPSFIQLVDDATTSALDITYAKQPEISVFRETSSYITRNGLTVIMPFPRFMFNSMELMGQYAGGASIPLTRKMTELVTLGKVGSGPLTKKDRQRITRNMMGMAAIGAAYTYRSSDGAPEEFEQISVGSDTQMNTTATYPMAQFLYLGEATKRVKNGTFGDWFKRDKFVQLFTGSNFRTGVGNSILEEVGSMASSADLTSGENIGKKIGRTLGNYLGTWAVPFAQVIDVQRAAGIRGTEYKDVSQDPTLDGITTFGNEVSRSFKQRGFFLSPEEEAALPAKEYPFYDGAKERVLPAFKFAGVTLTNKPSSTGRYLQGLGFDYRSFGSTSKVPSVKQYEQKMINSYMDVLVDIAQDRERVVRNDYLKGPAILREEFTEDEYTANMIRPLVSDKLTEFKAKIKEGAVAQGNSYSKALVKYRRVQPNFRKVATTDFVTRYGRVPDPTNAKDLNILIKIADVYKKAY